VTIPLDIAADVGEAAAGLVAAELHVLRYLQAGKPEVKAFAEARKAMMADLAALGRRVRARIKPAGA
jgi:hypothetical protein